MPDAVGEEGGDIAVDGVALGLHRAPLEHRDMLADLGEAGGVVGGQPAFAKPVGADQSAVDEEVGIAADRRGEVRVAWQREPEVAKRLGRVARLHLGAQHLLHDLGARVMIADARENMVEGRGLDHLAKRELDLESGEIVLEHDQFLAARDLVDAVHDRRLLAFQGLGRGDVGGDHIILDQPVRVQSLARGDREDATRLVKHDAALGEVEFERLAPVAGGEQGGPAGP